MNEFDALLARAVEQARALGIPVSARISPRVAVNRRAVTRFGCCIRRGGEYVIELSERLLEAEERACMQTLAHEVLHTCPGCRNHGALWKEYAARMNGAYGYAISRTGTCEALGVEVHYEAQFMDAPTLTGGVRQRLNDPHCCAVLDVGGDYIGARSIGGYAPLLNRDGTTVYYVINPFRPWSATLEHIDQVLGETLGVSHVELARLRLVGNPNLGPETTPADVAEGARRLWELVSPYKPVDYLCVRRELCAALPEGLPCPVLPIRLWLTYPWATGPEPDAP